jgi:hypothetical protein
LCRCTRQSPIQNTPDAISRGILLDFVLSSMI